MKILFLILAVPALFAFLLSIAMVRSAQQRYARRQIERGALLGYLATAAALWGGFILLAGALMNGMGLGAKSPLVVLGVALVAGLAIFAHLTRGVLWGKA